MRTIGLVMMLLAIFNAAMAADFSGQWKGQLGEREVAFQFKTDAGRLTGTVTGPHAIKFLGLSFNFYVFQPDSIFLIMVDMTKQELEAIPVAQRGDADRGGLEFVHVLDDKAPCLAQKWVPPGRAVLRALEVVEGTLKSRNVDEALKLLAEQP